jgi:hypothetical protein
MTFQIRNVKGDGHCYYRCIYQIAKVDEDVKNALYIENMDNEDEAIQEIRQYVASSLKCEKKTQTILKNLLDIYNDVPEISQNYPLLKRINVKDTFEEIRDTVIKAIEDTNMYASSFEHEVILSRFTEESYDAIVDLRIIILTKNSDEKQEDIADKWLRQLQPILKSISNDRVSILINEDNIHYKYMKFLNKIVIKKTDLQTYIEQSLEVSSEFETSSEEDEVD